MCAQRKHSQEKTFRVMRLWAQGVIWRNVEKPAKYNF